MATLHTLNKPLSSTVAKRMKEALTEGDAVILIEDACNSFLSPGQCAQFANKLADKQIAFYALASDCLARGLNPYSPFTEIAIEDFVSLTIETDKTVSWY